MKYLKYKGSIKNRLTSIIMLVTVLTGVIGYSTFLYWYMNNQHDRALKLSNTVGLVLSQDIAKLILLNEVSAAADISTQLKSFSNLNTMVLHTLDGKAILQYSKENKSFKASKLPSKENMDSKVEGNNLKLYINANYQDTSLGYVELNFKIDTILDVIKRDIGILFLILLLVIILSYFLASFFANKFTNPILKLVEFLEKVEVQDSFDKKITTNEDNEYGKLYEEVNTLFEKIQKSHEALKIAAVAFETQSAMTITDKNQKILRVNNAFTQITGFSVQDIIGKTPSVLKSGIHDEEFYLNMFNSLEQKHYWIGEVKNRHKDGSLVIVLLTIYAVLDENERLCNYVSSFIDLTAQKNTEDKLKEKENLLIQQSKMASMGEMLENIAHQWRQPLSVISTTSTGMMLKRDLDLPIDVKDETQELLKINETIQYLSQTIDDFREFFKPNKQKTIFKLKENYKKALIITGSKFKTLDIELIEDLEAIEIKNLQNELIQVIINLLNNAKDAFKDSTREKKMIFVNIYQENDYAVLAIKDSAGGIDEKIIDKVFDSHFTTKENEGSGIGLYMSKEMIENNMNGKLEVINENFIYEGIEYKGACFKIFLPIEK